MMLLAMQSFSYGMIKVVPCLSLPVDTLNPGGRMQTFEKIFTDDNGKSTVRVKVLNPCILSTPPWDAQKCTIEAEVRHGKQRLKLFYDYPDAQMSLIYFNGKEIRNEIIKGATAIFIPFYYCGNSEDYERRVSYMIFYKHSKYLYHIDYTCPDEQSCKPKVSVADQFKELPLPLKSYFVKYLHHKHQHRKSFYQE